VLAALTDVRLGLRDPSEVEVSRGDVPGFAQLLPRYRALLHAHESLDFDEQVHLAIELLLADPRLRARVNRRSTHLLVDEAQDLTPVFVLLVRVLAGGAQQLFAVGDDDQTIYGYAGATPRVLVDLPDSYRGTVSYTLHVNHRCPPAVVHAASALLAHNTVRVAKAIRPAPDLRPDAGALEVLDVQTDANASSRIMALLAEHEPSTVAVLARVGAALLAPQVALVQAGVPVERHVGVEVLARTGIRTALAYLRIAADPDRIAPSDLRDTLRRPARRLGGVLPPQGRAVSLARIARRVSSVDPEHREALRRYVDDLSLLAGLVEDGADSVGVLTAVRDTVGLGAALDALDRTRVRPEGSSHGDDLDALHELALHEPDPRRLPDWLADRLASGTDAQRGVTLSTVHRVKGREWDVVVLVGLRAGLVPHRLCDDVEEERRVLHVALTRAHRRLVLVTDSIRPSPFLPELLGTVRPPGTGAADEAATLAALKQWRRTRATADRVPAFLVAHDRTLVDIARRRPADRLALMTCHGIGPTRLERYGDELLAVIGRGLP
jgi:DNA helicase-2/ATP-dependent DNA helicase PcrA